MFLASLIALFVAPRAYVWKPAVTLNDPQIVSALLPNSVA
jgi:hypothetical protein